MAKLYVNMPKWQTEEASKYTTQLVNLMCISPVKEVKSNSGESFLIGVIPDDRVELAEYLCGIDALPMVTEGSMKEIAPELLQE